MNLNEASKAFSVLKKWIKSTAQVENQFMELRNQITNSKAANIKAESIERILSSGSVSLTDAREVMIAVRTPGAEGLIDKEALLELLCRARVEAREESDAVRNFKDVLQTDNTLKLLCEYFIRHDEGGDGSVNAAGVRSTLLSLADVRDGDYNIRVKDIDEIHNLCCNENDGLFYYK